jgi:ATP-dependent RNA helicase DDX27
MLKAAIKHSVREDQVRHRVIPSEATAKWARKLEDMKAEISEILQEEKEEKQVNFISFICFVTGMLQLRQAEMELKKGQNMIEHEKEIYSRPARTWFQSEKEKRQTQGMFCILPFSSQL